MSSSDNLGQYKMEQLSPIPPKAMMKARRSKKRAILTSLKWGEGWSRCSIYFVQDCSSHPRPQSPRSFWPVAGIESCGLVQHRKSAIHGLIVKSSKSDWLRIRNEYSAHAQKIGSRQSSRSLPQARRIVGSGDENA